MSLNGLSLVFKEDNWAPLASGRLAAAADKPYRQSGLEKS